MTLPVCVNDKKKAGRDVGADHVSFTGASYAMSSARPFAMAVTLRANALPMQVSKRLRPARLREVIPVEAKRDVV